MLKSPRGVHCSWHNRIKTTETRAKEVGRSSRRPSRGPRRATCTRAALPSRAIGDKELVAKIFSEADRFEGREGGYTRILKLGPRKGDSAPMVIIELVD
jgi:large subunit ribosomal protein L17